MQFKNLAAASSLLSLSSALPSEVQTRQAGPCVDGIHIIATPGEGSADPPYGLLNTLITSIENAIPGSSDTAVPYDHSQTDGVQQSYDAANTLSQYLQQYTQTCPDTKIALLGYSAGAIATMNVLCGEASNYPSPQLQPLDMYTYSNVVAAIAYGDETRTAGDSYDLGTCTAAAPHARYNPYTCNAFAPKIQSYCDSEDPNCCNGGTDPESHYTYADSYDSEATQFVLDQFNSS